MPAGLTYCKHVRDQLPHLLKKSRQSIKGQTLINQVIISAVFTLLFSSAAAAQLTPEQQAAKDRGIALYKQSDWYDSQPLLKAAAEAGDRQAQYYLGEAIRLSKRYTTVEAKKWYEAAAEQGDLYAMLRLSSKDDLCRYMGTCTGKSGKQWRKQAIKIARERAGKGDTQAMIVLFTANQGLGWLEKAAETGDGFGQQLLASAYKGGGGWFLIPGSREKAIGKWFKASAENGFPPGMYLYANFLYEHGGSEADVGYWLKKTAEAGHIEAMVSYALNIAHLPERYGLPLDLVKAYGLTYMLSKLEGGGIGPTDGKRNLPRIAEKMNEQEIRQGIAFAEEWEKTHPPLSYFDPIYGY
ncbi:tetratricopeptide repeat protein [Pseudomonas extremaustralis]|nr:tetratricopeptide repeat protein [Pseudomonas extremaustralis]MDF3136103.1 tetratricopeptide repeat protein [Pseudomonas extremaustralis]